jgi:D-alanine-D-alanine ligase
MTDPTTHTAERRTSGRAVVVLLGGPSAEHDVSVVSGWAIADGAGRLRVRRRADLHRPGGRWWQLPATAAAGRPRPGTFDDPAAIGAQGPWRPGEALDRIASRPVAPIVFPALCTARSARTAPSRRCSRPTTWPYAGAGVAASAVGMDKALFKRLVRGLGMPVVDWVEVTPARWAERPRGRPGELAAFSREGAPARCG